VPTFRVKLANGKHLTLRGDEQPTDADIEAAAEHAGERQEGKCGICAVVVAPPGSGPTGMVIDHCHTTNKVRALLCNHCNRVLGFARDNADVLGAAARAS
jgi:recombination endonuclease VII